MHQDVQTAKHELHEAVDRFFRHYEQMMQIEADSWPNEMQHEDWKEQFVAWFDQ